jgi:hypothetical protein
MLNTSSHVLAFDIGIRNLAWCLMKKEENKWTILGWDNYDLLAEESSQTVKNNQKVICSKCKKRAQYTQQDKLPPTCAKCCPESLPALRDLSGELCTSIPNLKVLKDITSKFNPKKKDKKSLLDLLKTKYSMPIVRIKASRSKTEDLAAIHSSIQRYVDQNKNLFEQANHVLLENQPAFKNPTMKSVQILLFATLRDRLEGDRYVGFVHAGKKGSAAKSEKGDKGYVSRKKASEERVTKFFETNDIVEKEKWTNILRMNQKKSDLSDAMCMCIDRLT